MQPEAQNSCSVVLLCSSPLAAAQALHYVVSTHQPHAYQWNSLLGWTFAVTLAMTMALTLAVTLAVTWSHAAVGSFVRQVSGRLVAPTARTASGSWRHVILTAQLPWCCRQPRTGPCLAARPHPPSLQHHLPPHLPPHRPRRRSTHRPTGLPSAAG